MAGWSGILSRSAESSSPAFFTTVGSVLCARQSRCHKCHPFAVVPSLPADTEQGVGRVGLTKKGFEKVVDVMRGGGNSSRLANLQSDPKFRVRQDPGSRMAGAGALQLLLPL